MGPVGPGASASTAICASVSHTPSKMKPSCHALSASCASTSSRELAPEGGDVVQSTHGSESRSSSP